VRFDCAHSDEALSLVILSASGLAASRVKGEGNKGSVEPPDGCLRGRSSHAFPGGVHRR
jgi:hypothetical protein